MRFQVHRFQVSGLPPFQRSRARRTVRLQSLRLQDGQDHQVPPPLVRWRNDLPKPIGIYAKDEGGGEGRKGEGEEAGVNQNQTENQNLLLQSLLGQVRQSRQPSQAQQGQPQQRSVVRKIEEVLKK